MAAGTHTTQLTFEHDRARTRAPRLSTAHERAAETRRVRDLIEESVSPETIRRLAALNALEEEFHQYLASLGVGEEFQSADFWTRLHELGATPDPNVLDERVMGGVINRYARLGLIRKEGYRSNAGCPHTGYNGTARPVWRIVSLERPADVLQRRLESTAMPAEGAA